MWADRGREHEAGELLKKLEQRVGRAEHVEGEGALSRLYDEPGEEWRSRVIEHGPQGRSTAVQLDATAPPLQDQTGQRLLEHIERAVRQFEEEVALSEPELLAINQAERTAQQAGAAKPGAYAAYRGSRIDALAKAAVMNDPELAHIYVTVPFEQGADFYDSVTGTWYDITTTRGWQQHVQRYGDPSYEGFRLPTEAR
jgi:hypothetical protein